MDELYAFLFAGLIILMMLFVFFGDHNININTNKSANGENEIKYRIIELGNVSMAEEKKDVILPLDDEFEVHNGVFFGSLNYYRKFDIKREILDNLNDSKIGFSIEETNNYGNLMISLNNETIYNENSVLGYYSLEIKPKEENLIEFETTSSGLKIWAPSLYKISNLSLQLSYTQKEVPRYEFDIPPFVYNNFYKADVLFTPIKTGKIRILVNGKEVYNSIPEEEETVKLKKSNLILGENEIEFLSDEEYKLENVEIRLFYVE